MRRSGVVLKPGKEKIFQQKHLWIFSGAIASFPEDFQQGQLSPIYSHHGELLGQGYFHQGLSLCGRILSFGAGDPWQTLSDHIERALAFREAQFNPKITNAFRLINGEGDLIPGLILDQYDDTLVLQSGTLGMDLLKEKIVDYLVSKKKWRAIYEKSTGSSRKEEGLKESIAVLEGKEQEKIRIIENGLKFDVPWRKGQKTGFFLDQREMRKHIETLSQGRRVLNSFCYNGGFSLYALRGGAKRVDSVDVSKAAIAWTRDNLTLNGFSKEQSPCFEKDAFEFLSQDSLQYDLVILDPPAFAKKKQDVSQASKGYREINSQALAKMPKNSFLLTCSCSYHIDEALFQTLIFQAAKMAKKNVQIVGRHLLAQDHPINLFHPESHYLKSLLLYLF